MLNQHIPNHPVFLTRIDGHCAWVNECAFKISNTDPTISIDGGKIINECILVDNTMEIIRKSLPKESPEMIKKWIQAGTQYAIEKGITNVHDAWQSPDIINAIIKLVEEKKMPLRCYGMIGASFKDYIKNGLL